MADAVLVVLILVFIWAAVLVPPAAGARAAREAEFLGSIRPGGHPHDAGRGGTHEFAVDAPRFRPALTPNARRRQILGGLVVGIAATLLLGLLPTFRLLLVVHLFLVNSFLVYVGLMVRLRDGQAGTRGTVDRPRLAGVPAFAETRADDGWYEEEEDAFDGYQPAYASAYRDLADDAGDETSYAEYAGSEYDRAEYDQVDYDQADYDQAEYDQADYGEEAGYEDDEAEAAYLDEVLALARPA